MGILRFIKDVALLPVDIAKDITGITMIQNIIKDDNSLDPPLDTLKRLESMKNNWDKTYD